MQGSLEESRAAKGSNLWNTEGVQTSGPLKPPTKLIADSIRRILSSKSLAPCFLNASLDYSGTSRSTLHTMEERTCWRYPRGSIEYAFSSDRALEENVATETVSLSIERRCRQPKPYLERKLSNLLSKSIYLGALVGLNASLKTELWTI